jgi:tRNA modification GTPase
MNEDSTICAISTPAGTGAIAVIRLSGKEAIDIADKLFVSPDKNKRLANQKPNTVHFGNFEYEDQIIDQVVYTIFREPYSYTGEDVVEISCHGSVYIQQKILETLIQCGAQLAKPGEFTLRAFMNGKMDLPQAEAVADLIDSKSQALHDAAIRQMRGGFSNEIAQLRQSLLEFASLIELELDFSEEDVEFANREQLKKQIDSIQSLLERLINSFKFGNVIKNGIPVTIIGRPNVGKSTLLNALLNEEKAIVSDIPGTTRDVIEDTINIQGFTFRFIDTAGIRQSADALEKIGIERTFENIRKARLILFLTDIKETFENINNQIKELPLQQDQELVVIINKIDTIDESEFKSKLDTLKKNLDFPVIPISAKKRVNIHDAVKFLIDSVNINIANNNDTVITNARHYESLKGAFEAGNRVIAGINNSISGDLLAQDIREMLYYLGSISGEITTDEILGNIFRNFCIGK